MFRFPSKSDVLRFLQEADVSFGTIVDVGVYDQTKELRLAFPDKRHILFEPASEMFSKIDENYSGMNYELVGAAVSDLDGKGILNKIAISGNQFSHSFLQPLSGQDSLASADVVDYLDDASLGSSEVETIRLDTFFNSREEPDPFLLKVDVDGNEIPVLEGAKKIWDRIDVIIIEASTEFILERLEYICKRGFRLIDIVDQCYYRGLLSICDLVFVSERLYQSNSKLRPWEDQNFSWSDWVEVSHLEAVTREHASLGSAGD